MNSSSQIGAVKAAIAAAATTITDGTDYLTRRCDSYSRCSNSSSKDSKRCNTGRYVERQYD